MSFKLLLVFSLTFAFRSVFAADGNYCRYEDNGLVKNARVSGQVVSRGVRADCNVKINSEDNTAHINFSFNSVVPSTVDAKDLARKVKSTQAHRVYPLVDDQGELLGSAYELVGRGGSLFLSPLHVLANRTQGSVFLRATDGVLYPIEGYLVHQQTGPGKKIDVDYYDDFALFFVEEINTPSLFINTQFPAILPEKSSKYLALGFPYDFVNLDYPNESTGDYIQTHTDEHDLLLLPRIGEGRGSSGGPVFDLNSVSNGSASDQPAALTICNFRDNLQVAAIKLAKIQNKINALKKVHLVSKIEGEFNFVYQKRDGCDPIGRGIRGD